MIFKLTIDSGGNEAMQTSAEVADALRNVAERVGRYEFIVVNQGNGAVVDANGNAVGKWGFET